VAALDLGLDQGHPQPAAGNGTRFVELAIDAAGAGGMRTYTYAVPDSLADLEAGEAVMVEFGWWLALGLANLANIFDPSLIRGAAASRLAFDRAYFEMDRFLIETMAIRPQVGVEAHFARYFFVRGDFGFPLFIDVGDNDPNDVGFAVETGAEFEARAPVGVGGGIRLQVVGVATDDYAPFLDKAQAEIEPFFSYEPFGRTGFFARLGFPLALDRPLGFGFDCCNRLAAVRAHLGGKW